MLNLYQNSGRLIYISAPSTFEQRRYYMRTGRQAAIARLITGTYFLRSLDRASLHNSVNKTNLAQKYFLSMFIFINLYMFRATMCPSSGETAVFMRHLVLVIVWMTVWYAGAYDPAHQEEKQLCLCDTWYLLFCVDDCLVCRSI